MSARLKSIEQRVCTRVPIRVMVEYQLLDDFLADYTANVSLGGMFVETKRPLDEGTRFRLRLRIPGRAKPVETYGEVRWTIGPGQGGSPGMGIAFDDLTGGDRRDVQAWLAAETPRDGDNGALT